MSVPEPCDPTSGGASQATAADTMPEQVSEAAIVTKAESLAKQLSDLDDQIQKLRSLVARLEKQCEDRESEVDDEDEKRGEQAVPIEERVKPTPSVAYFTVHEYEKREFSFRKPYASIDAILMADTQGASPGACENGSENNFAEHIRFIQINSPALVRILQVVTGALLMDDAYPRIICSPFHPITHAIDGYQAKLAELEKQFGHLVGQSEDITPESKRTSSEDGEIANTQNHVETANRPESKPPGLEDVEIVDKEDHVEDATGLANEMTSSDPPTGVLEAKGATLTQEDTVADSLQGLLDLRCLMQFYHEWIEPRWKFLRGNDVVRAYYGDLCTVFQPGDYIYVPEHPQKIFRITKVTDGRPEGGLLYNKKLYGVDTSSQQQPSIDAGTAREVPDLQQERSRTERPFGKMSRTWSKLYIDCYRFVFDGKHAVNIPWQISLGFYTGQRDISSLEVYPLRLAKAGDELSKIRLDRQSIGNRLLEVGDRRLFYYNGRSLSHEGDSKDRARAEDVTSSVVIDFEKAFQVNDDSGSERSEPS